MLFLPGCDLCKFQLMETTAADAVPTPCSVYVEDNGKLARVRHERGKNRIPPNVWLFLIVAPLNVFTLENPQLDEWIGSGRSSMTLATSCVRFRCLEGAPDWMADFSILLFYALHVEAPLCRCSLPGNRRLEKAVIVLWHCLQGGVLLLGVSHRPILWVVPRY